MRPRPVSMEQARENQRVIKQRIGKVVQGVKNYGKNVAGGAKIVGGVIKKGLQWPGKQIEKEMKMNKAKDDEYRRQGENMMNGREEYDSEFKYGYQTKKK